MLLMRIKAAGKEGRKETDELKNLKVSTSSEMNERNSATFLLISFLEETINDHPQHNTSHKHDKRKEKSQLEENF